MARTVVVKTKTSTKASTTKSSHTKQEDNSKPEYNWGKGIKLGNK